MENFFHLKERGTTVSIEIIAGITTFVAMSYILMVNPNMFLFLNEINAGPVTFGSIYIATSLSAVIGTVLIGLLANLPLAQASGMGLNAFFVYTVCAGLGFTYANALVFVMFDGALFIILTVTGLRRLIFDAIPPTVKKAIAVGIGLFIAFLGLQDAGIVIPTEATGVTLASFNILAGVDFSASNIGQVIITNFFDKIVPTAITIGIVIAIARLSKKGIKGAILISMVAGTIVYYVVNIFNPGFYDNFELGVSMNPLTAFAEWKEFSFMAVFRSGFDFSSYLADPTHSIISLIVAIVTTSIAFCMVDMFDTSGTLYGACKAGDLLVKNEKTGEEEVPKGEKAMLADAIASFVGSPIGTSTVTTFVESSSGVAAGGRTGLAALITGALFFIASFFAPIAALVPSCAYAAALIYVGILMMSPVKEIEWTDPIVALPAFITIVAMPFTYSISNGIAFGLIMYIGANLGQRVIKRASGGSRVAREEVVSINPATWIFTIAFLVMLLTSH